MKTATPFKYGLIALAGTIAAIASASTASAQNADRLAEADANGDGDIEWQEMLDMRTAAFERLDRNGDGFADSDDSPRFGPAKNWFNDALAQLQNADADGDGRISASEMLEAPAPLFENGDTNGDKVLSSDELSALREAAPSR